MANEEIKAEVEKKVEKVIKVSAKKHKDGLLSGIRIVAILKTMIEQNPLPSYISILGNELYVTYTGQTVTYRYSQTSVFERFGSRPNRFSNNNFEFRFRT